MDIRTPLVLGLLVPLLLAGCTGSSGTPSGTQSSGVGDESHGTITGLVVDDEQQPVSGATVGVRAVKVSPIEIRVFTDEAGRFRLENIPTGKQTLLVNHAGFREVSATVTVLPATETDVRIVMNPLPRLQYQVMSLEPLKGQYECAVEAFQTSGSCDYEVENRTGQHAFQTKNNHSLEIPADLGGILFEVSWTAGQDPSLMDGIRFYVESQEDIGGYFVKTEGLQSPMRIAVNGGQVAPDATLGYPFPERGVKVWIDVLPLGKLDGASCQVQCGYGVGVAASMTYEVHVTYFFGGPVDPNYSALTPEG